MANDTIGSMTAVIRATAAQFSADMQQSGAAIKAFADKSKADFKAAEQGVDSFREHLSSIGEGLGIGAGIELMHVAIEKAHQALEGFFGIIERGNQLTVLAQQLGSTASELSGLQYAAELLDVSAEQLNTGLEKMEKAIGQVHAGNKEAAEAFQELHISMARINDLSAGDQFLTIADAIRELKNPADEAAEAMKIFGKSGMDLLPVIDAGSATMRKFIQQGKELHRTLTDEDAKALAEATESIRLLKKDWEALTTHLAVEFVPVIRAAAQMIDKVVQSADGMHKGIADAVLQWAELGAQLWAVVTIAPPVISAIRSIVTAIEAMTTAETFAEAINPATIAAVGAGLVVAGAAVAVIHSKFNDMRSSMAEVSAEASKIAAAAKAEATHVASTVKAREQLLEQFTRAKELAAEVAKAHEKLMKSGEEMTKSLRTPLEKYADALKDIKAMLDASAISAETFRRASVKAAEELINAQQSRASAESNNFEFLTGRSAYEQAAKNDANAREHEREKQIEELVKANSFLEQIKNAVAAPAAGGGMGNNITLCEVNF